MRPVVRWTKVLVAVAVVALSLAGCGGSGRQRNVAVETDGGGGSDGASAVPDARDATADRGDATAGRDGPDGGQASIVGTVNVCPLVVSVAASPIQAAVGGTIDLAVMAQDPDTPGPLVVRWWVTPAGAVADPAAASTEYTCAAPGTQTIAVSVSDGMCDDTETLQVFCVVAP